MRTDANWIQMGHTGGRFWPTDPRVQDVHIEDIAHALANLCRFTGHTKRFYSVAQHSVRVMRAVEIAARRITDKRIAIAEVALWALLHDSEEAYMNDLSTPVKRLPELVEYKALAANLRQFVVGCFGCFGCEPQIVIDADQWLLRVEAFELLKPCFAPGSIGQRVPAPPNGIVKHERPMGPWRARKRFLYHYWRLRGIIDGKSGVNLYAQAILRLFR